MLTVGNSGIFLLFLINVLNYDSLNAEPETQEIIDVTSRKANKFPDKTLNILKEKAIKEFRYF